MTLIYREPECSGATRREELARLRPWLEELHARLGVADWTLRVPLEDIPEEGADAAVWFPNHRRTVTLSLADSFFGLSPEDQRECIAHEFIHIHQRPIMEAWCNLDELLGKPAYALFRDRMVTAEEVSTDTLARAIAPLLPLPPTVPPGETKEEADADGRGSPANGGADRHRLPADTA